MTEEQPKTNRKEIEQTVRADRLKYHLDEPEGWSEATVQRIIGILADPNHKPHCAGELSMTPTATGKRMRRAA